MSSEYLFEPTAEQARRIRAGDLSPVTLVEGYLDRIEKRNDVLNAYVTVLADHAREAAHEAETAIADGADLGPLHGIPIALKDVFGTKSGISNTFCSVPFADNVAERDATFVRRLQEAGAIVLGKTNAPEFAVKGTTDNLLIGPTSTPFDSNRNAGGSSGGSAAAVADGLASVAHGSDGGGSLRIPAAWCGTYTLKPTFRRVAAAARPNAFAGHTPYAHHGPITRTVEDAALLLDVMTGPDPRDPHTLPDTGVGFRSALTKPVNNLIVGYTPDFGTFPVDPEVEAVVDDALDAFVAADVDVARVDVDLGYDHGTLADVWLTEAGVVYASLADAFADDGLDLLADHREDLTDEFVNMVKRGRELSAVEYRRTDEIRTSVFDGIVDAFEECDLLVSPTLAVPPVENGDDGHTQGPTEVNGEQVNPLIGWCLTYLYNFTGHPAASIPAGLTDDELPVGLQIAGPRYRDEQVLAASHAFERERPWQDLYPPR